VTHPIQQRRFRHISASAIRASEKGQLSRIGSRPRAFLQAIDEVCVLPLTPQSVAQKTNSSFKNRFPYISVIDKASVFKFGKQLGFAKANHIIPLEGKVYLSLS